MDNATPHIAENSENLERFVLGRLKPEESARIQQHIGSCEACRSAVETERRIAAGVKRYGREALKAQLAQRLGNAQQRSIPWPHILTAAAVLCIIIGVGTYNWWYFPTHREQPATATDQPVGTQRLDYAQSKPAQEESSDKKRTAPTALPPRPAIEPPHDVNAKQRREPAVQKDEADDALADHKFAAQAEQAAAPAAKEKKGYAAEAAPAGAGTERNEFWAEGTLFGQDNADRESNALTRASKTLRKDVSTGGSAGELKAASPEIRIEQRPASALPRSLQSAQRSQQTVRALVRKTDGQTELILFPDSLFDAASLRNARTQQVAPDSFLVQIGTRQIGFRIPADRLRTIVQPSQQQTK